MPPVTVLRAGDDPDRAKEPFRAAPWALKLFDDPSLKLFANEARIVHNSENTADTFVGKTLATQDTIRAWQSFWKAPDASHQNGQVLSLLSIGSGVNGHIDTCHGGFVSLLVDEALGLAAENSRPADKTTMTAYLHIDYRKPVKSPAIVLCRAWVEKVQGKKLYIRGTIEDAAGTILTDGHGLFIIVDRVESRASL